jgi:adenylosuccinate synthase
MVKKKAFIIVGLGFGDEGKGLTTDYLCQLHPNSIVVRYNGGHQAGHTVTMASGEKHTFSNFGAGSFRGISTFWSSYCTFAPAFFIEEYQELRKSPKIFIDESCPVTTHYDVLYNQAIEISRGRFRHGSCGVGFGATIDRNSKDGLSLLVADLFIPSKLKNKLRAIRNYYNRKMLEETNFDFNEFDHDSEDAELECHVSYILELISNGIVEIVNERVLFSRPNSWDSIIFEGSQGILLDKEFGTRPFITKSNTTSKNAIELLYRNFSKYDIEVKIFYVTRSYHTRHGMGPFQTCYPKLQLINAENETNQFNLYQGNFKTSCLNLDLLNYSINCDTLFSKELEKNLVVTCIDQLNGHEIPFVTKNTRLTRAYHNFPSYVHCKFADIKYSFSSCSDHLLLL